MVEDYAVIDMSNSAEQWYCLATQPKREHIAANHIRVRAGIEAFCPRIAYEKKTRRGIVRFVEPLFPNYLFVYCDIQAHLRHLLAMQGVRAAVKYGDRIPNLPASFIEDLKTHFSDDIKEIEQPELQPGETVALTDGPFQNLQAIVQHYYPANDRVKVLLEFLGREISVDVSAKDVIRPDYQPKKEIK